MPGLRNYLMSNASGDVIGWCQYQEIQRKAWALLADQLADHA